jgi:glyoxylase-like metal-dependent hydrolase (beta-lactamase superfamily II)
MMMVEQEYLLHPVENPIEQSQPGWDSRIEQVEVGGFVRSHIIFAQNFTLVYDTLLGPLSGNWLARRVQQRAPEKPVRVLVSHSDWDHCWGNQSFSAPIYSTALCAERMSGDFGRQELDSKRLEHPSYQAVVSTPPTHLLEGSTTWDGGDMTFQLLHTPGHRPDHLALYIPELKTLLPGDAVETPFALLDEHDPQQDLQQMLKTLTGLLALPVDWLLCNHAPAQMGNKLVAENLKFYQELKRLAAECESVEELAQVFPYLGPTDQDFYRKDHARISQAVWKSLHPN